MAQSQTLTVDQQEILARATEVESPMVEAPGDVPTAPCVLTPAVNAAQQLLLSADNMRTYFAAGDQERQNLGDSLRNAAGAYGGVDEDAAAALHNDEGSVSPESGGGSGTDSAVLGETQSVVVAGEPDFTDLKTAAMQLAEGDQGASLLQFAEVWAGHGVALEEDIERFRPFETWQGDAATACEASLEQQEIWILHMAKLSTALGEQAQHIVQLHRWAVQSHPQLAAIEELERLAKDPKYQEQVIQVYAEYQQRSEQVLTEYASRAALEPVNPPQPPAAIKIDAAVPVEAQGLIPESVMSVATSSSTQAISSMSPASWASSGTSGSNSTAATAGLSQAAGDLGGAAEEPGMNPASFDGGGGGGGGAPSSPMAPALGADGQSVRPAGAGDVAGLGQGKGAAGGPMGGGGMGMPMGGQGQAQGSAKSKGAQQDDEALYTEDRAWTEAVIGNRRRPDNKESR